MNLKQLFDDTAKNATKRRTMKPWHPEQDVKKDFLKSEKSEDTIIDKKEIESGQSRSPKRVAF